MMIVTFQVIQVFLTPLRWVPGLAPIHDMPSTPSRLSLLLRDHADLIGIAQGAHLHGLLLKATLRCCMASRRIMLELPGLSSTLHVHIPPRTGLCQDVSVNSGGTTLLRSAHAGMSMIWTSTGLEMPWKANMNVVNASDPKCSIWKEAPFQSKTCFLDVNLVSIFNFNWRKFCEVLAAPHFPASHFAKTLHSLPLMASAVAAWFESNHATEGMTTLKS